MLQDVGTLQQDRHLWSPLVDVDTLGIARAVHAYIVEREYSCRRVKGYLPLLPVTTACPNRSSIARGHGRAADLYAIVLRLSSYGKCRQEQEADRKSEKLIHMIGWFVSFNHCSLLRNETLDRLSWCGDDVESLCEGY